MVEGCFDVLVVVVVVDEVVNCYDDGWVVILVVFI